MLAFQWLIFLLSILFLSKLFRINGKCSIIIICASELDCEIKFKQFMFLLDKTEPERRIIGRYKATNGFKNCFSFFLTNTIRTITLVLTTKVMLLRIFDISSVGVSNSYFVFFTVCCSLSFCSNFS